MDDDKIIGFCGIICTDCPAYKATQKKDNLYKIKLAEAWRTYKYPLQSEDIDCDGCIKTGKKLIGFCNDCEIRQCGMEKSIKNCAYCSDFPCEKLENYWRMNHAHQAKTTIKEMREYLEKVRWSNFYPILSKDAVIKNVPTNSGIYSLWETISTGLVKLILIEETDNLAKSLINYALYKSDNIRLKQLLLSKPIGFVFTEIGDPDKKKGIVKYMYDHYLPKYNLDDPGGEPIKINLPKH